MFCFKTPCLYRAFFVASGNLHLSVGKEDVLGGGERPKTAPAKKDLLSSKNVFIMGVYDFI